MIDAEPWEAGNGLHGYAWNASRPRGVVLLQHGYAEHAGRYVMHHSGIVPALVAQGLSVRAFDMRGHGLSPGRRGVTDVGRAVADHGAARRALAASGLPLFVFGHSLGGLVTAASVAADETGVAGVVLSSPALLIPSTPTTRATAGLLSMVSPGFGMLPPQSSTGLSSLPAEVSAFENDPLVHRGYMPAMLAGSALSAARDGWRRYAQWRTPTLVVHGDADTFTDSRGSGLFVGLIASADKSLVVVPGGRHELLNDVGGEAVRQSILRWIDDRIPPPPVS